MRDDDVRLKNLKPWKKGQSGNPHGAQMMCADLRDVKKLTHEELALVGSYLVKGDFIILEQKADIKVGQPALVTLMCRMLVKAHQRGDQQALDLFLNRVVGKVTETVISTHVIEVPDEIKRMSDEQLKNELIAEQKRVMLEHK